MAQMEVSYSRRLDYQYMIIDAGEDVTTDYRLAMLVHNRIDGFLPLHMQQMNGKSMLSYDITSLEALPAFLDARKVTYDEMVSLLLQFCSAVSEAGRYLLDGEGILLEPQYIYVSKSLERVQFCYYPYQHMPLYQSVNVLCRFLIDHIDYDDRQSLELAYGLFQESLKENLSISVIVGCIKNKLDEYSDKKHEMSTDTNQKDDASTKKNNDRSNNKNNDRNTSINTNIDIELDQDERMKNPLYTDKKNADGRTSRQQSKQQTRSQTRSQTRPQGIVGAVLGTLLVIAVLGYVLITAGKRLLQLQVISENMLIAAGILIAVVAVIAGAVAYGILKRRI